MWHCSVRLLNAATGATTWERERGEKGNSGMGKGACTWVEREVM
jgi:hypothetical protein